MTDKANKLTHKLRNKQVRKENIREQISNQGHIQHVIELARQIEDASNLVADSNTILEDIDIKRFNASTNAKKIVIDTKLRLISKYLPDVKSVEHSGEVKQVVINDKNQLEEMLKAKGVDPDSIRLQ